jgi:DnaJ-class molecular chaperone
VTWILLAIFGYLLYRWVDDVTTQGKKERLAAKRAKKAAKLAAAPPPELVDGKAAHDILGVDEDASAEDVRAAFQRLMKDHHPDRVANLGPAEQRRAEAKAKRLSRAYEIMKKR